MSAGCIEINQLTNVRNEHTSFNSRANFKKIENNPATQTKRQLQLINILLNFSQRKRTKQK